MSDFHQKLELSGATLLITKGNNVDLSALQDGNTDDQDLSLSGTILRNGDSVDLSVLQDGTGNGKDDVDLSALQD